MWEIISVISSLVIHFYSPKIPDCKNSIDNTLFTRSFPYQYFEGEILTSDQVKYRFRIIYKNSLSLATFTVSILPTLTPKVQMGVPLFPSSSIEQLIQQENYYCQNNNIKIPIPVIQNIVNQLELTDPQVEKFKIITDEFISGKITDKDVILKLRAGDGLLDVAVIAAFVLLVNWLNADLKSIPLSNMDPAGWLNNKYQTRPIPPITYKSSKFQLEMAGIKDDMCVGPEMRDENGFIMSYEQAYNLVAETYPGYMEVDENFKISDWQAAKHMYHANGMGVSLSKYGFTQTDLEKIRGESKYKGGGLIAYARRGYKLPPIEMVREYQLKLKTNCEKAPIKKSHIPFYDNNGVWKSTVFAVPPTEGLSPIIIAFNESTGDFITGDKKNLNAYERFKSQEYLGGKKWMLKWTGK